ncbi:MAG: phenylalanine--tRNA ligase subunit beta, partial [Oscillospiraceae bacterium]|nr:phenylalanine--tRNA ligase subunit beta [Oscillospiraceae bacterium]
DITFTAVSDNPTFHPGRCAEIFAGEVKLGVIGEVHPTVLANFEIGTKAYCAAISMDALFATQQTEILYKPLPKFPAVTRDLALVCDESVPAGIIEKTIFNAAAKLIENIKLFDIYRSEQLGKDKKSLAFSISLRSAQKTLTTEEADNAVAKILKALENIGVTLR